ncbi:MAG: hypothetical protein WCQ41_01235 [Bacillota bacterium]
MNRIITIVLILVFALGFTGCTKIASNILNPNNDSKTSEKLDLQKITSDTRPVSLTVPSSWKKLDATQAKSSCLFVGDLAKEQYVAVISESSLDFETNLSVEGYFSIIKTNMSKAITSAEWLNEKTGTLNGQPSIDVELNGFAGGIKLKYLIKIVKSPKAFNQILSWTLFSKGEENRKVLTDATNTFEIKE